MNLELESERLLLRPLVEADVDLGIDLFGDPEVMRFIGTPLTPEQVASHMPESVQRAGGGCVGVWCVSERTSGEKLGTALLLPIPIELTDTDWSIVAGEALPEGEIEIGYLLKRAAWGRGYATEAAARLLRFAFEDSPLEEVVAVTDPENRSSRNVLSKIGMTHEGMRRAYRTQCCGYRIARAQWLAKRP